MTILITGTKGFIGRNLKQALSSHNIIEVNENIFIHVDWRDYLKQILDHQRPEFIFHVGASSDTMNYDIEYMMTRNWESTTMLSKWA
ncbi:MAG: NAD-dependent epimerase/dehydratase family protein, partial [Actinobacteria bacterium]|nr:NAD-dependent epimerase/dehydratase family protein [Actinomycetota bacterium]